MNPYVLLAAKKSCDLVKSMTIVQKATPRECFAACPADSPLFLFGRRGSAQCFGGPCSCQCLSKADVIDGNCTEVDSKDFDIYKSMYHYVDLNINFVIYV